MMVSAFRLSLTIFMAKMTLFLGGILFELSCNYNLVKY